MDPGHVFRSCVGPGSNQRVLKVPKPRLPYKTMSILLEYAGSKQGKWKFWPMNSLFGASRHWCITSCAVSVAIFSMDFASTTRQQEKRTHTHTQNITKQYQNNMKTVSLSKKHLKIVSQYQNNITKYDCFYNDSCWMLVLGPGMACRSSRVSHHFWDSMGFSSLAINSWRLDVMASMGGTG